MQVIDIINEAIDNKTTKFAFELLPPLKGEGTSGIFSAIDPLVEFSPSYINVTYHREDVKYVEHESGLLEKRIVHKRPGTVGISAAIKKRYGIEVVPHMICGGWSKYDIEDALIDMDFLGINNILALRGDNMRGDNSFKPYQDGLAHADELVSQVVAMNKGVFLDGEVEECHHSKFCVGVAGYPEKHADSPNIQSDMEYLKRKVDAGASYIVTQMCFDTNKLIEFERRCRDAGIMVPIIPALKPLSTKTQVTVLPHVFHVDIPQELVAEVDKCSNNREVRDLGVEWAIKQGQELKRAGFPVIHLYTMGKTDNIARIAKELF